MDDPPLPFNEPPRGKPDIKRVWTTEKDVERSALPGWKTWAVAVGITLALFGLFYATLTLSRGFATAHAAELAYSLAGLIGGAVGAKIFHKEGEFRVPRIVDWLRVAPLLPLAFPIVYLVSWSDGERRVVNVEAKCLQMVGLSRTDPAYERSRGDLWKLEAERESSLIPTRPPGEPCEKFL